MCRIKLLKIQEEPSEKIFYYPYKIYMHSYFNHFINLMILGSIVLMSVQHYELREEYAHYIFFTNLMVTIIYDIEVLIKILAL